MALVAAFLLIASCGELGLGDAECVPPSRHTTGRTILTVEAVPSARYTPCIFGVRLGWDEVDWSAESGRAGFEIWDNYRRFLTVTVTEECDVSDATPVDSGYPDIQRYEAVTSHPPEIPITIVPASDREVATAFDLVVQLDGTTIDGRPVVFGVDDDLGEPLRARVDQVVAVGDYAWIIDRLDAAEDTVQMRSLQDQVEGRGLTPDAALELIEAHVPDVEYKGQWYFTFDGGCITYDFDAQGVLAETVAADAELAIGFYPAYELRALARDEGYDLGDG